MPKANLNLSEWVTFNEIIDERLLEFKKGKPPARYTLSLYCRQSVQQFRNGERPLFHRDDGSLGCHLDGRTSDVFGETGGNQWLVHREAVKNLKPLPRGRPDLINVETTRADYLPKYGKYIERTYARRRLRKEAEKAREGDES